MKKTTLLRSIVLVVVVLLLVVGGNAKALSQFTTVYLPLISHNSCGDFFDDFSDPSSGWYVGEDKFAKWEYQDGEYRILSKDDDYFYWSDAPTCARENYSVEVDARWAGDSGISYGLLIGNNIDFDRMYSLEVNAEYQVYSLYYWDGFNWETLVQWTDSPYINAGTASNHLKATRNGNQIAFEVNGNVLGTWAGGKITGPTYTAVMSAPYDGEPNSDARFDNYRISPIAAEPPAPTTPPPTTEIPLSTTEPPDKPAIGRSNTNLTDGTTDQNDEVGLSQTGDDPGGHNITFDVCLESCNDLPDKLVSDDQSETSFDLVPRLLGVR